MDAHAEGVLPDHIVRIGGDDLLRIELVPSLGFAGKYGANGRFIGGLLCSGILKCKDNNDSRKNERETHRFVSST